jgi:TRAP-type C4-dicarboxylate transport system permease small subunit
VPERPSGGKNRSMMKVKRAGLFGRKIVDVFAVVSFATLILMMLWMTIDTALHPFGEQIPATYPWIEVINVIAISLGLVYVTAKKAHIAIELLNHYLSAKLMHRITVALLVLVFVFLVLLSWQWSIQAWRSTAILEFQQETIKVYYFLGKIALAIGFVGSAFYTLVQIINEGLKRGLD